MRTLVLGMILLGVLPAPARQEGAPDDGLAVVRYDSSAVVARAPAPALLQAYRDNPDFVYDRAAAGSGSWWDRFKVWLWDKVFGPLDGATESPMVEWIFYLLAAAGIVYAIARLLRMDLGGAFSGKKERARLAFETVSDDIREIDFDRLIDEAVAACQYRRAVRLLYLKTLKTLAARHLIDWQRDKTNHEYIDELRTPALRRPFAVLTTLFEYVWYGDFPVDEAVFGRLRGSFTRFDEQLQKG